MKQLLMAVIGLFLLQKVSIAQTPDPPRTPAELNRWYVEPPTNQNAATFILKGISALNVTNADWQSSDLPWIGGARILPGEIVPATMNLAISNLVYRNRSALPHFQKGVKYDQCRYSVDFTDDEQGQNSKVPHLRGIMAATGVWAAHSLWLADANRGAEAGETVIMNLCLARSLESEPDLCSQMRRGHSIVWTIESFEQVVNRSILPPPVLEQLGAILDPLEKRQAEGIGFTRGLIGWRALLPGTTPDLKERRFEDEMYEQLLIAWKEPFPGRIKTVKEVGLAEERIARENHLTNRGSIAEFFEHDIETDAHCLASLRLAQTAVALEQYRAAHHNLYPQFLSDLVPAYLATVPEDPFDGKPLRYRKADKGYILHSVGPDLKDDRGLRKERLGLNQKGDIVFTVVKPPDLQQ